ncbi:Hint domain-containing protein [Aliiroseovarius sp. YM-037]|uniref:Hint domain-containing protein n=1 Tax=Aliiroseovarius sp. YM-037 TaxID=3341728 RepID=UPI003A7FAC2B
MVVTSSSSPGIVGNPIINNSSTPDGTVFLFSGGGGATVELNDTGGSFDTFEDDNPSNHVITDGNGLVADGTQVEAESLIRVRALDDMGNPTGPLITLTVFSQGGLFSDVWGFGSTESLVPGTSYQKISGSNTGSSTYSSFVTCFGAGTMIDTVEGPMPVDDLEIGQHVLTHGNGPMPIRWVSTRIVPGRGAFAPVVFAAGAIGNTDPLTVSQQHRIFLQSGIAEYLFGQPEILVPAKHLVGMEGVSIEPVDEVCYTHFMFDSHQVVRSNGALTESFFLAKTSISGLDKAAHEELLSIFPCLDTAQRSFGATAAPTLRAREASVLRSYLT